MPDQRQEEIIYHFKKVVENHFNCPYYLRVEVDINNFIFGGNDLKIEEFKDITIAYMRNIGEYGKQNEKLMEDFKKFLRKNKLFTEETTILGIALDNPAFTPTNRLRYDVGLIIDKKSEIKKNAAPKSRTRILSGRKCLSPVMPQALFRPSAGSVVFAGRPN